MFGRVLHVKSKHRTDVCLCYLYNIEIFQYTNKKYIQYSQKQYIYQTNTLFSIILELMPMYTLVSEGHVFVKAIWIKQLSSKST